MSDRANKRKADYDDESIDEDFEKSAKQSKRVCVFCLSAEKDDLLLGEILTKGDLTCHYFCLLLAGGLYQNGRPNEKSTIRGFLLNDIRNEVKRGFRLKCCYCNTKGATLGCCGKRCKKAFHLPCGRANGSQHQFFGGYGSYCDEHRQKQSAGQNKEITEEVSCSICLIPLDNTKSADILHSPCCNNSWFHHRCIQQYAISAGKHHFRCPLCNCRKKFHDEMQEFGVYIPDQDASWERQTGAFEDLLERHSTCDADTCSCSRGRNHDAESGKYELILCSCCGSFGSHRTCRGLVWYESSLVCPFCASIGKEFVEPEKRALMKKAAESGQGSTSGRTNNTQRETGAGHSQEVFLHLEMADSADDVDVDGDGDIRNRPVLTANVLRKARFLPSCSVMLQRIDRIVPLSQSIVDLKNIPGFIYVKGKGHFKKRKGKVRKSGNNKMNEGKVKLNEIIHKLDHKVQGKGITSSQDMRSTCYGKHDALIKQFDLDDTVKEIVVSKQVKAYLKKGKVKSSKKIYKKRKGGKENKHNLITPNRDVKKKSSSPLSSTKKQKALKFLMKFNRNAQQILCKKRKSQVKNLEEAPCQGSDRRLVQSTLNFVMSPPHVNPVTKSQGSGGVENLSTELNKSTVQTYNEITTDEGDECCKNIEDKTKDTMADSVNSTSDNSDVSTCSDGLEAEESSMESQDISRENEIDKSNILMDCTNKRVTRMFSQVKELRVLYRECLN